MIGCQEKWEGTKWPDYGRSNDNTSLLTHKAGRLGLNNLTTWTEAFLSRGPVQTTIRAKALHHELGPARTNASDHRSLCPVQSKQCGETEFLRLALRSTCG